MSIRIKHELRRLDDLQLDSQHREFLRDSLETFKRKFNQDLVSGFPGTENEKLHFLKSLKMTLEDTDYLGDKEIDPSVIKARILNSFQGSECVNPPICGTCKLIVEGVNGLIDTAVKLHRKSK